VVEGLENAVAAFKRLFSGQNFGSTHLLGWRTPTVGRDTRGGSLCLRLGGFAQISSHHSLESRLRPTAAGRPSHRSPAYQGWRSKRLNGTGSV
jgi:hypothetical protein